MKSIYRTKSPEETIALGERLGYRLTGGDIVLLFGDLGSGKTHFAKGIAKGLGIKETIKSPTFAYVNKYQINHKSKITNQKYFFHYDLYRLHLGDDLSSIGFEETIEDEHAINVIEWADRIANLPKKYVMVELETKEDGHVITIEFIDRETAPVDKIEEFYSEWKTPLHVRAHIKKVADVAMKIAEAYIQNGEIIDVNLLYSAAAMHDIARVCDFRKLDRAQFVEKITDEKWNRWEALREEHKGLHHADIAERYFKDLGYKKTAEVIYVHKSRVLAEEPERINTLEKKIMYYSDKRVKHEEVVPLKERFRDGWERYGKYDDTRTREMFDEVEKRTFKLEKELFDSIDLKPEDL
jgi:tRNA threonylcarbamoyladenosine biosynthesis protein TsaE